MSVLTWGKPTLEIAPITDGTIGTYTELATPVESSTKLTTTKGSALEAKEEGGAVVDKKYKANSYALEFELFAKDGASKPISDTNGVISSMYAIRLTPEDSSLTGYLLAKCNVSVEDTWDADNGGKWKYTFEGLLPDDDTAILAEYTASSGE
jgi:hypothetical protein